MGRTSELNALRAVLAGAEHEGTALLLQGDPGVGKTVLLDAVAARARADGLRLLRLVGVESEQALAFSALHQLLYPLFDHLGKLPSFQSRALEQALSLREGQAPGRFALSAAALALVQAASEERPLAVVVDDVHWIDRSSAEVLTFLTRRLGSCRAAFVMAARSKGNGFLDTTGLRVLDVGPLAPADALTLLNDRHPGLAEPTRRRLLQEAEGNPLALVELPGQLSAAQRDGIEALPVNLPLSSRLESVFADRFRALTPPARFALLLAALDGQRPGNLRDVRAASAQAGAEEVDRLLEAAERVGLIRVDHLAEQVTFRHPLARSCVVHMSPGGRRRAAHGLLASVAKGEPERRAWHLAHASDGPDESVAVELTEAAERTLARGGAAEAAAAFRRAAELSQDRAARTGRLDKAAFAAGIGGLLETARELAEANSAETLRGTAAAAYVLFHREGDIDAVFRVLVPVMRAAAEDSVLEDSDAFDDAFYVLLNAAVWAGRAELWPPVYDLLGRVSEAARMCFDAVADPARTAHDVRQRLDRATAALSPATPSWRVTWLIYSAMYVDCFAFYDGVWRDLVGHDAYDSLRFAQVARAHDAFMLGDWDKMIAVGSRNIADAADHEYNLLHMVFTYGLAMVASGRGDEEALRGHCEAITAWAQPRRMNLLLSTVNETRARAAVGRGDFEEAFALTAALTPPGELTPHFPHFPRVFLDLVESAMRTGRVAEARAHVEAGRQARIDAISPHHALILAAGRAITAPDEQAEELYEAALALPDAGLWTYDYARTRMLYGEWLRRRREYTAARVQLSAALELFEQHLKSPPWARRARNELRAAGVDVGLPQGGGRVAMSAQERRIAELAASGLSNKQIAQQLNISPRTAGAHLYRVFPKLGITSRAALRDALKAFDE
ncbi:AAA family ATPase [Streptomyces panaciradicis]|uniref:AAA family ATPase n=1 Tax=Streptomyces panaciradicis TaxID=1470261 RepID=UPI00201D1469|nr:LuxR family transcriptional regulator [Streptomyces panaciradicis]MCL6670112.1 AAA family ATPase [Streptomyces panaciradicis]